MLDTPSHICFKLIQQNKNSTEARAYCEQDGGQLLKIRDAQQQSVIVTYLCKLHVFITKIFIDAMISFLLVCILTSTKHCQKAFLDSRYPVSVRLLDPCVGVGLEVKN